MVQLIVIIMAIALGSYAIMAGVSYLDLGAIQVKEREAVWSNTSLTLSGAWVKFGHKYNRAPLSTEELLSESSAFYVVPDGFTLTVPSDYKGWCFTGQADEQDFLALARLSRKLKQNYGLSSACGHHGGVNESWYEGLDNQYPKSVALTFRIAE